MTSKTLLDKPKCHWDICLALLYQRFQCCNNCVSEKNSGSAWAGKMLGQNYWTITICTSISTLHPLRVDIASCHDTASGAKQHRIQGNQPRHASALTYAARSFDTIAIWNDGNSAHFQSEESLQMFATSLFSHTMGELSAYNLFQLVKNPLWHNGLHLHYQITSQVPEYLHVILCKQKSLLPRHWLFHNLHPPPSPLPGSQNLCDLLHTMLPTQPSSTSERKKKSSKHWRIDTSPGSSQF